MRTVVRLVIILMTIAMVGCSSGNGGSGGGNNTPYWLDDHQILGDSGVIAGSLVRFPTVPTPAEMIDLGSAGLKDGEYRLTLEVVLLNFDGRIEAQGKNTSGRPLHITPVVKTNGDNRRVTLRFDKINKIMAVGVAVVPDTFVSDTYPGVGLTDNNRHLVFLNASIDDSASHSVSRSVSIYAGGNPEKGLYIERWPNAYDNHLGL